MNSRKTALFTGLAIKTSPLALGMILSGCLAGENKTFFDYRNLEETEDPTLSASSNVGNSESNSPPTEGLLCCNIETAQLVPAHPQGCDRGLSLYPTTSGEECRNQTVHHGLQTAIQIDRFDIQSTQMKKIDFLFVVDNSGSMEDNQAKLAAGFESFANTFFRRDDLDICIAIITSDRYLGRRDSRNADREKTIPCTKPSVWNNFSASMKTLYINQVINEFRNKINVGTRGSGLELIGKSLVTYLHNMDQWNETGINRGNIQGFFRRDSVANITILTDENNWFYRDPQREESRNDLPVISNAAIYNAPIPLVDVRKGIKEYLDEYFTIAQPDHIPTYSISTFLETSRGPDTLPGLAMNLNLLSGLVGRESAKTNIADSVSSYTQLYESIGTSLVNRASAYYLTHEFVESGLPQNLQDLTVTLIHADGTRSILQYGMDYSVLQPNAVVLSSGRVNQVLPGDFIEVQYRYLIQH